MKSVSKTGRKLKKTKVFAGLIIIVVVSLFTVTTYAIYQQNTALNEASKELSNPDITSPTKTAPAEGRDSAIEGEPVLNGSEITPQEQAQIDSTQQSIDRRTIELQKIALCQSMNSQHWPEYQYAVQDAQETYDSNIAKIEYDYDNGVINLATYGNLLDAELATKREVVAGARAVFDNTMLAAGCTGY